MVVGDGGGVLFMLSVYDCCVGCCVGLFCALGSGGGFVLLVMCVLVSIC